eukprot:CAMPEP_0185788842 /NCGR_PEP_ID=MMETSP1174-20130828/148082_1 /TAXON_ID=35687 /ORGANISM="Dictyocha speculum, Strain CCMP1381" /LENGTH=52 /DNA_ID=CAMNT_0028482715 /DNA_START=13 /DNA_END=167 /DNA_ORIENTATION=-
MMPLLMVMIAWRTVDTSRRCAALRSSRLLRFAADRLLSRSFTDVRKDGGRAG